MRKWSSAALAVAFAALLSPGLAMADKPSDVYSDYAADGVLSCGHSKSALQGVLNDASLYQYGDPYTFIGLKLAVRKQLAGGCRPNDRSVAIFVSPLGGPAVPPSSEPGATRSPRRDGQGQRKTDRTAARDSAGTSAGAETLDERQDGRMVFLGVVLLLLTLGSGGWAARRAFSDDE